MADVSVMYQGPDRSSAHPAAPSTRHIANVLRSGTGRGARFEVQIPTAPEAVSPVNHAIERSAEAI